MAFVSEETRRAYYIGLVLGCIVMILTIFVYGLMIYYFCNTEKKLSKLIQITTISSINLSAISILFSFATFPVCSEYFCYENALGHFFLLTTTNSYILSKISVYIVFITRLHLSFHSSIYQYSNIIFCVLFAFTFFVIVMLVIFDLNVLGYDIDGHNYIHSWIPVWSILTYASCDILLSLITLVLFVLPLSKLVIIQLESQNDCYRMKPSDSQFSRHLSEQIEQNDLIQAMTRYIHLGCFALLSSMMCGSILVFRFVVGLYGAYDVNGILFLDIVAMFCMVDNLISMWCIMLNFSFSHEYYRVLCCKKCCDPICTKCYGKRFIKTRVQRNISKHGRSPKSVPLLDKPYIHQDRSNAIIQ
eukprot:48086_1